MAWYNREVFAPDIEYEPEGEEPYTQPSKGQDGAQHMLKYIHDYYPAGGALTRFDQAFGAGAAYPRRQYDLYLQNGNLNYIEFKSYKQTTYFGNAKDVEQLLSYLSRVNNLSELRYVFNAKKLSPQQAKEKMQGVFAVVYVLMIFSIKFTLKWL